MIKVTNAEMVTAIRAVAAELLLVANAVEACNDPDGHHDGGDFDWEGEWSTHTLSAYAGIYDSITH